MPSYNSRKFKLFIRQFPLSYKQVQEQLGLHSQAAQRRAGPASPLKAGPAPGGLAPRPGNRFILPLSECEFMVTKVGCSVCLCVARSRFILPLAKYECMHALDLQAGRLPLLVLPHLICSYQPTCCPACLQTLDELQRDAFPAVAASRPARALGTAVQVGRVWWARGGA